jgi:hypothetical protein
MWRHAAVSFLLLAAAVVPACSASSAGRPSSRTSASTTDSGTTAPLAHPKVTVAPTTGGRHSRFVIRFRAPEATGRIASIERHYQVIATGPPRAHCLSSPSVQVPATKKGARARVVLNPSRLGGVWCLGRYRGGVREIQTAACPPGELCPAYVILLPRVVGKFTFRVTRTGKP